jgi:hypothetical protein
LHCSASASARVGGHEGHARLQHQALLGGPHHHVDAQRIHRERRCGQRSDHVDHVQGRVPGGIDGAADRRQITRGATGSIGVDREHRGDPVLGVGAQRGLDRSRVDRLALDVRRAHGVPAIGLDLLGPAIGKVPGARHQDRRPRTDQIGDHRLPAAVAVGGVEEHLRTIGLQQPLHARLAGVDELRHARVGQVGRLARHGMHHLVGHVGGARGMQRADAGDAGAGGHGLARGRIVEAWRRILGAFGATASAMRRFPEDAGPNASTSTAMPPSAWRPSASITLHRPQPNRPRST